MRGWTTVGKALGLAFLGGGLLVAQHGGSGAHAGYTGIAPSAGHAAAASSFRPSVPGFIPSYGPNGVPGSLIGTRAGVPATPVRGYHGGGGYGGYPGYGGSYSGKYRSYRRVPSTFFFTPYYYPFLDYGASPYYGDDALASYGDQYAGGSDPALTDQVARLSAEVSDLRNNLAAAQQSAPPPGMYPPPYAAPPAGANGSPQPEDAPPPAPPVTVILQNGQTLQVQNYAVMDNVLWDFSKQPARQIPLSTINIAASAKATEANGAEFPIQTGR